MIALYVLLVLVASASGSRDLDEVCSRNCILRDQSKYSDKLAPNIINLFLAHCSELDVLRLTPNLHSLVLHNCESEFNLEVAPPLANLSHISIFDSHISELHNYQFAKMSNLNSIDLGGNSIERLCNETFHHLSSLRFLYLRNNLIEVLPECVFYPLENLSWLDLSNNKISILTEDLFSRNAVLLNINLKGNPLTSVAFPTGWPYSKIYSIDLSNCGQLRDMRVSINVHILNLENSGLERLQIKGSIEKRVDHAHSKLTYADFHETKLNGTEFRSILCGLQSLEWLDLSKSSINTSFFNFETPYEKDCSLPSLRFVNMSGNKLKYIPRRLPLFGFNLTTLDLSHNLLEEISLESFAEAHSLQNLYLEGNRLTSFDYPSVCEGLKNLKQLALFENLFNATFYDEMTKYFGDKDLHLIETGNRILIETDKKDRMVHLTPKATTRDAEQDFYRKSKKINETL